MEVRLEDRFEDQLERGLHGPVGRGGDPQAPQFPVALGDPPLPDRQRRERAGLQFLPQPRQERLARPAEIARTDPVDSSRACSSIAPHPSPRHGQEGGVGDEVNRSANQRSGLSAAHWCSFVSIFSTRCPAAFSSATSHSASVFTVVLLAFQRPFSAVSLGPFALLPAFPASDYYSPSAPSRAFSRRRPARRRPGRRSESATRNSSHFHLPTSLLDRHPAMPLQPRHRYAADLPYGLLTGYAILLLSRRPYPFVVLCRPAHIHQVRACSVLEGFHHWFTSVTPLRLACRTRPVSSCRPFPALSEPLPALPLTSRIRLPSASPPCCDRTAVGPSTPPC